MADLTVDTNVDTFMNSTSKAEMKESIGGFPFTVVVAQDGTGDYNGTTHTPIQAAIDAVEANGGGCVFIKNGTYLISTTLTFNNARIELKGEGAITVLKQANGSNIDRMLYFTSCGYSHIHDFYIDGNKTNQSSGTGHAIDIYKSARFKMSNLWIWNPYGKGIILRGDDSSTSSHAAQISNIMMYDPNNYGLDLQGFAYDTEVTNFWLGNGGSDGINMTSGGQFFTNIHVWSVTNSCIRTRSSENRFVNCYLESSGSYGIDAFSADDNRFVNCYIWKNDDGGVQFDSSERNMLDTCHILSNGSDGVKTNSSGAFNKIINCHIQANYGHGINFNTTQNNTVIGTTSCFNGYRGISISSSNNCIVKGNHFHSNGARQFSNTERGIDIYGTSSYNIITENQCNEEATTPSTTLNGAISSSATTAIFTSTTNFQEGQRITLTDGATTEDIVIKSISGNTVTFHTATVNAYSNGSTVDGLATQVYGINISGTSDYNILKNNIAINNATANLNNTTTGVNNIISDNIT